jgi:hypothetical protein
VALLVKSEVRTRTQWALVDLVDQACPCRLACPPACPWGRVVVQQALVCPTLVVPGLAVPAVHFNPALEVPAVLPVREIPRPASSTRLTE